MMFITQHKTVTPFIGSAAPKAEAHLKLHLFGILFTYLNIQNRLGENYD